MSLEKGKAAFRILLLKEKVGQELEATLMQQSYTEVPPTDEYTTTDICRGRTLWGSNTDVSPDFLRFGTNLYFAVRSREKKLDSKIVAEYLAYMIEKEIAETGEYPTAKRRKEISQTCKETLTVSTTEKLSGIRVLAPIGYKIIVVEGSSVKNAEAVQMVLRGSETQGDGPASLFTPSQLFDCGHKDQIYFPFPIKGKASNISIGADFLTWLWMASETPDILPSDVLVSLCGDIAFKGETNEPTSSVTTKLSKGTPWQGEEPKAAFEDGKKVSSAKFRFVLKGGLTYDVTIDENFAFSGFNVVDGFEKGLDVQSAMNDKAMAIIGFLKVLTNLFYKFMSQPESNAKDLDSWINNRWESNLSSEGPFIVFSDATPLGEVDIPQEVFSSTDMKELVKILVEKIPKFSDELNSKKQALVFVDARERVITLTDATFEDVGGNSG